MEEILEQVRGICRDVWRYRWIALAVAWGICLFAWTIVLFLPEKFEAQARVFVDPSTALKPVIQGLAVEQDVNAELNFVRQGLMSRTHLQKIVDETGLAPRIKTPEAQARVLDDLAARIDIAAQPSVAASNDNPTPSKVYTISYKDGNRDRSIKVVQILLDSFMEGTLGGKRSESLAARKFLEGQIKEYETRLSQAEESLAEFKKRNVGMVPGDQQSDYFTRLQNEIDEVKKAQTALGVAENRRTALAQQLRGEGPLAASTQQPTIAGQNGNMQGGGDTLSRIQDTQAKLDELLLKFTDKHPDVVALRQTLSDLKQRRALEIEALKRGDPGAAVSTGASSNPVYQSIQLALNTADVEIAGLRGELSDHQQKVSELRRMVDTMPQVEAEFARLNRDYAVNKAQYTALVDRLEKARLGGEADATGSVRFEIIDAPSADYRPVSPKRTLLLFTVFLVAIGAGGGVAYLLTILRPVFHSAKQLGAVTGAAVLGVVSATRSAGFLVASRRQYLVYAFAFCTLFAGLVGVVLVGKAFSPLSFAALHH
jgi:polysaccharide chain length determinant protein (PEP-CTERM system associated)